MMDTNDNTRNNDRLKELSGSDFEIADGHPNIIGWNVKDTTGGDIGEVDELIFDTIKRKVLYLVVDLEGNDFDMEPKKVLVPIGLATLHEKDDEVILAELTARQLDNLPEYIKGKITPVEESTIRNSFTGLAAAVAAGATSYESHPEEFYEHEHFDQNRFYNSRIASQNVSIPVIEETLNINKAEVQTGGAQITTSITEHPVEETINLKEEHVYLDRVTANRPATEADFETFKEGQIELIETKEVPVITKEARVVEEVKISKTITETEEIIRDTIRKTEVDIERMDEEADGKSTLL